MSLAYADLHQLLPHRYPMLLIDAVRQMEPGVSIEAVKCVTGTDPCYQDLGPSPTRGETAYPSSLILESFVQAAAVLLMSMPDARKEEQVLLFGTARDVVFLADVYPGQTLVHRVMVDRVLSDSAFFSGVSLVDDRPVARYGWVVALTKTQETTEENTHAD